VVVPSTKMNDKTNVESPIQYTVGLADIPMAYPIYWKVGIPFPVLLVFGLWNKRFTS